MHCIYMCVHRVSLSIVSRLLEAVLPTLLEAMHWNTPPSLTSKLLIVRLVVVSKEEMVILLEACTSAVLFLHVQLIGNEPSTLHSIVAVREALCVVAGNDDEIVGGSMNIRGKIK